MMIGLALVVSTSYADNIKTNLTPEEKLRQSMLWDGSRASGHAPLGVMMDHTHSAGEFMFSYRYKTMSMQQNYKGSKRISDDKVISPNGVSGKQFMVTPTDMQMEMHMFGFMYAPHDNLTLMMSVPYVIKSMNHLNRMGVEFKTESEGIGDITFTGLVKIYDNHNQRVHLNFGFSAPTGSINQHDVIPGVGDTQLPFPMQIGTGTFNFKPGVTYMGQWNQLSWGAQVNGFIPVGKNDNGYQVSKSFDGTGWVAWDWTRQLSTSARIAGKVWSDYDGQDERGIGLPVPTADGALRSGEQIDLSIGANFFVPEGFFKGNRIAVEAGKPVYLNLDGPQLATDWFVTTGWQIAW